MRNSPDSSVELGRFSLDGHPGCKPIVYQLKCIESILLLRKGGLILMNIAMIAGSNRREATSTKLCKYLKRELEALGCTVVLLDLYELPLPFYTSDNKNPNDANLQYLKQTVLQADAVVLATPDYHGSVSGVLKNALDHLGFDHFDSKAVLSVSSSGGAVGVSPLQQLQVIVRNVHGINCPEWISIGAENRVFDENGVPANAKIQERAVKTLRYFVQMAAQLRKSAT